jgi:hypothetical protein
LTPRDQLNDTGFMTRLRAEIGIVAAGVALAVGCGSVSTSSDGGGRGGGGADTGGTTGTGGTGGTGGGGRGGAAGSFTPTRDVDILFMVDNSSSTESLQKNLLQNFPTFMSTLQAQPGGLPNIHIAVITSDIGAGDGSIAGCDTTGGNMGIFQYTPRGTCTATHLTPGETFITNINGVGNYTGNLADVFSCIAQVGSTGCGFEQPLAAIARALGADGKPAPAENAAFLRPNALLFIVIVTNEDDCSVPAGSLLYDTSNNMTLGSALGPPSNFRCNEFGHLCNGAKPPRKAPTGSISDTVTLTGCTSAEQAGMLTPVATFVAQLRALKQFPDDQILISAIAAPPTPYTVNWKAAPTSDTGPWPFMAHSCTATDGSFGDPAVRIANLVTAFGANGVANSVCDTSYASTFDRLGQLLGRALNPSPH